MVENRRAAESEAGGELFGFLRPDLPKTHRMINIARRRYGRYYFCYDRWMSKRRLAQGVTCGGRSTYGALFVRRIQKPARNSVDDNNVLITAPSKQ